MKETRGRSSSNVSSMSQGHVYQAHEPWHPSVLGEMRGRSSSHASALSLGHTQHQHNCCCHTVHARDRSDSHVSLNMMHNSSGKLHEIGHAIANSEFGEVPLRGRRNSDSSVLRSVARLNLAGSVGTRSPLNVGTGVHTHPAQKTESLSPYSDGHRDDGTNSPVSRDRCVESGGSRPF